MDESTKQALFSAIRSLLIVAGTSLAAHGFIASGAVNEVVGAIMVIIPVVWGVWDKVEAERATKAREVAAVNAGIRLADLTPGPTPPVAPAEAPAIVKNFAPSVEPPAPPRPAPVQPEIVVVKAVPAVPASPTEVKGQP